MESRISGTKPNGIYGNLMGFQKPNLASLTSFHLFLKECEWRFNNSDPKDQLKQLNQWVKKEIG